MSEVTDDFLAHHGVVGMKWGKRSGGKKAPINKANLKVARKEIYGDTKSRLLGNKKKKGAMTALAIVGGAPGLSLAVGISLARSAGYSKGKAAAIGFIGGAPAGILVSELSARKAAREED